MLKIFLSLAVLLGFTLSSQVAFAQTDSISSAIGLVDSFTIELEEATGEIKGSGASSYLSTSKKAHKTTVADIKSLGWTEAPGKHRVKRLFEIVEGYTNERILKLSEIDGDRQEIKNAAKRLTKFQALTIAELKKATHAEVRAGKSPKAVPIIDRSRFEENPGGTKGIWER